ncbi:hypothetical protein D918_06520 [Trichuris suis]|nr:hypothetical protein D918_06520 [Trichuris suis]
MDQSPFAIQVEYINAPMRPVRCVPISDKATERYKSPQRTVSRLRTTEQYLRNGSGPLGSTRAMAWSKEC